MWEIWANKLLTQALKSCPKSNKSSNLVTLLVWQPSKLVLEPTTILKLTRNPGGDAGRVGSEVVEVSVVAWTGSVSGGGADNQQVDVETI